MHTLKLIFTFLIFLLTAQVYSQTFQWRVLSNSPLAGTATRFEDVYFIDPNTGWVSTYNKIYRTTNSGINWTLFEHSGSNRSIGFFDSQSGIVGNLDSTTPLSRTINGGVNWSLISNFPSPEPDGVCGISIVNENTAYVCGTFNSTAGRAYKTSDKGESWSIAFNDTSLAKTLIDCYFWTIDSGIVVGGYNTSNWENGNAVVLRTTNGGTSWERVHKTTRTREWCWKISFISRNIGFVSIERFTGFSYILKTTNNGLNWSEIPFAIYDQEGIGFVNENTGWVGGWGTNFNGLPTYETTNGGANWHQVSWGKYINRFRFLSDTLAYAVGDSVHKYSRQMVGINLISSEVPSSFQLHQNYPNPFNPVTKIKFDITREERSETRDVRLVVYDAIGRDVTTLVSEKLSPGSYEVDFDGSNFSSGIYFYKFNAGKFSEVKRMLLLK